ncbi:proline-rich protein 5 isoform X1 [Sarcophilus harrisii]|uniref:Proline rich 5 n=1 Tax=Sarcophilus harrisii TaxID=9305 RepID=A0A7N4PQU8_SARHA|nr:proline-rich protein 5 isoform X1 [Sarcophilus harrisii]
MNSVLGSSPGAAWESRLKFMSSPSLSDLGKREQAALDERGAQQRQACSNATWNSIHNGVIAVFQKKGLPEHQLFHLNEGVRQLLKTELGSFFTEYLQNQLLTKGMVILRDKIRFYEGQKLLDSLAETWDFFFGDVLPTLQAIFYPVQGKEPSVRQLALLHFRNIITLNIKLEDALSRSRARIPPSIVQMLLVLQGVHESKGITEDYLKLEALIQKVVSPYLGTYGLYSNDGPFTHSSCILEKRFSRRPKAGDTLAKNPVVRSKSYNTPLLTPVAEYEAEGLAAGGAGVRRHSVSEMTSCPEAQDFAALGAALDLGSQGSSLAAEAERSGAQTRPGGPCRQHLEPSPPFRLARAGGSAPSSSPENLVDQILESMDSDSEGIFINFDRGRSKAAGYDMDGGRQSVV